MKQTSKRSTLKSERDFRLSHRRASGERAARPMYITPDLSDRSRFERVHRYRIDRNMFAVFTAWPLALHELFRFEGVVYKVARTERIEGECWEVKGVVFKRLQS